MDTTVQMILTIIASVLASSGFWAYIQKKTEKRDVRARMLLGLAHDRIMYLGNCYLNRKDENGEAWITQEEYENFYKYLYEPYETMGGNGSAKRLKMEVDKLPIRNSI